MFYYESESLKRASLNNNLNSQENRLAKQQCLKLGEYKTESILVAILISKGDERF